MSLDFYLEGREGQVECICPNCNNEHSRKASSVFFSSNITHNLGKMAGEAGIYEALWRPEEKGWEKGGDIIEILEKGLADLKERPDYFKQFDAPNGWGLYEHFVPFAEEVLAACKENPTAIIKVSR